MIYFRTRVVDDHFESTIMSRKMIEKCYMIDCAIEQSQLYKSSIIGSKLQFTIDDLTMELHTDRKDVCIVTDCILIDCEFEYIKLSKNTYPFQS